VTDNRRRVGSDWEDAAARLLDEHGITVIARGYSCRLGELDIVALDGDTLVVVEVRARRRSAFGRAAETVDWRKQRRIVNATRHFLMRNPHWFHHAVRFDVIAVDGIESNRPSLTWVRNAFNG
jgi:putative endonuclease